jgi:hypothetical protein
VKKLWNSYGQEIKSDNGYLDPRGRDPNIYVFDGLISNRRIDELITFLLISKIEAYRGSFEAEAFLELKGAAMGIAERTLTSIEFIRKIRFMIFDKRTKTIELVERAIKEMENDKSPDQTIDDVLTVKKKKEAKHKFKFPEFKLPKWSDFMPPKSEEAAPDQQALEEEKPLSLKDLIPDINVRKLVRATALAAAIVLGGGAILSGAEKIQEIRNEKTLAELDKIDAELLEDFSKTNKSTDKWLKNLAEAHRLHEELARGFKRLDMSDTVSIGVNIERGYAGGSAAEAKKYASELNANFETTPPLSWGFFMSEKSMNRYNGESWEHDKNAPDFADQKYDQFERFAHYQKVGKGEEAILRTLAGGSIDVNSIKVLRADGTLSDMLMTEKLPNGEYKVKLTDMAGVAVTYQTLKPAHWHATAETLTDADFANLDSKAYEYYTRTPNVDLRNIKFQSTLYPQFYNLDEFVDYLKTLKPINRVNVIRGFIGKMRYTRTERTETAFRKFHNHQLPEKEFLEFIMNSSELENPGDGDCDVQNTVFALIARYAGIPSKLDYVITTDNIAHAPASIFLPKIGWILSDTMGTRSLIEEVGYSQAAIDDSQRNPEKTEEDARKKLIEKMQRRTEYMARKCYEVQ